MNCCICGTSSFVVGDDIYKCPSCKHIYVDFLGDTLKYHKSEYRTNSHGTRSESEILDGEITEFFHKKRNNICNGRLAILQEFSKKGRVLDIGSGGGTFALKLRSSGFDVECQEISSICINYLKKNKFKVYEGDFCSLHFDKTYDIVTCWHVLEHLKNLQDFVKKCSEVCSNLLILEVPINRTIHPPNKNWDGHFHYFSKESLAKIFKEHFEVLSISEDGCQKPCLLAILKKK